MDPGCRAAAGRVVELIAPDQRYIGHGSNRFAALRDLRQQLDEQGISIGVNGALPNCTVSGMLADIGEGRSVYALQMGARGRPPTLPTLGPAPLDHVGTVAQQDAFCELAGRSQAVGAPSHIRLSLATLGG